MESGFLQVGDRVRLHEAHPERDGCISVVEAIDGRVIDIKTPLGKSIRCSVLDVEFVESDNRIKHDPVRHPGHYTSHPSGVECIDITEHMTFNLGNAVKYVWRAGKKGDLVEDLKKAVFYIQREISRVEKATKA